MKAKLLCCLSVIGLVAIFSLSVLAKPFVPQPYTDNIFCWYADVPDNPSTIDVQPSRICFIGSGGIKINGTKVAHDRYEVRIDGGSISANGGTTVGAAGGTSGATSGVNAERIDGDFSAPANGIFFVDKTATCTLSSAVGAAGKEILVWNACPAGGVVTYKTTQGQTISGAASGSMTNATKYKLDRFMSDGNNWYKE